VRGLGRSTGRGTGRVTEGVQRWIATFLTMESPP
jgi:hypothetical protein